jgi:hypothetical protein
MLQSALTPLSAIATKRLFPDTGIAVIPLGFSLSGINFCHLVSMLNTTAFDPAGYKTFVSVNVGVYISF